MNVNEQKKDDSGVETKTDEISLSELVQVLWQGRGWIAGITTLTTICGIVYALLATPIYQAETTIMPPQQQQSAASSMMAALGGLGGGGGGIGAALGLKNPNDIYVAMFKSKRVGEAMLKRFDLVKYYEVPLKTNALTALTNATQITAGKDGLISIKVEDKDPKLASTMANAYVEEFRAVTKNLAVSEASQRRRYFEEQLQFAKSNLAKAEGEFKVFQERTGLVQADQQGKASVDAMAALRAQIAAKEVELKSMTQYAAEGNPQVLALRSALGSLRGQLAQLTGNGRGDKVFVSKGQAPELAMEYARKYREVKYYEVLFEMMAKQYEMARMDEAKDGMVVQVVDEASVPELRTKPKRSMIAMLSLILGVMLSCVFVFVRKFILGKGGMWYA